MDGDEVPDPGGETSPVSRRSLTTFPFSKTTCVCNCGKYNLQDLPRLRVKRSRRVDGMRDNVCQNVPSRQEDDSVTYMKKILPEDYEYKLCEYLPLDREDKFLVTLRMALSTREEALEWKRRFEERSLTTHVKDKTFPKVERVSIFKAQYRCQFFDRRKNKKKLPEKSKFRDCHSILFINIKRYFKNTVDRHMPAYQMVVRLHYAHNHPLDTADVLKKRQLSEDIKCRFLEMFRQGMKPKDALDKHKRELLQNLGPEKYRQVVCDGYYVPNVPKAYRLYYQIHGKGVSAKTTTKRSSRHNPNPDWIAFQNFPDAIAADEDCDDDDDVGGSSSDSELIDNSNEAAVVIETGGVDMEQQHNLTESSFQGTVGQPNNMTLTSRKSVGDTIMPQDFTATQSLGSTPVVNGASSHYTILIDDQLQKEHPPHKSVYSNARDQHLPVQTMPVSSYDDTHLGMGLFNLTQPTWENFRMAHQQTAMPNIQQSHSLSFQRLDHQNPPANYMILPNSDCQNTNTHFTSSQGMMNHNLVLQNPLSQTDLNINGSDPAHNYSWTHIEPDYNVDIPHPHHHEIRRDQTLPQKHVPNQSHTPRKLQTKKTVRKKKKTTREVNMKRVTKRWMDKKPKVEAETQNLASEVLQTILLADEAEKLKVRLLTFLSGLEIKLVSNPKLFVPALRDFLHAGEGAEDDCKLATYLKDFGKTEENVIKNFEAKRKKLRETFSTQTKLSGPVFKVGKAKPWRGNTKLSREKAKSNISISTCGMIKKSISVAKVKYSKLGNRVKKKLKSNMTNDSSIPTEDVLQSNNLISISDSCLSEPNSGWDLNDKNIPSSFTLRSNHEDGFSSNCSIQLKKTAARTFMKVKDKHNIPTQKYKKRCKHKTENTFEPENFTEPLKAPRDIRHANGAVHKNLVVKFTRIKQTVEQGKDT